MNDLVRYYATKLLHLSPDLVNSRLYDENTFYYQFINDLKHAKREVIIVSPYIASVRMYSLLHLFGSLVARKIKVYVVTRDPEEHDLTMGQQAEEEIRKFEAMGVQVLITQNFDHRKIAIIDRKVLYEGSLNILSQSCSREIMRRIESEEQAKEMFRFIRLGRYIY